MLTGWRQLFPVLALPLITCHALPSFHVGSTALASHGYASINLPSGSTAATPGT